MARVFESVESEARFYGFDEKVFATWLMRVKGTDIFKQTFLDADLDERLRLSCMEWFITEMKK